MKIRIFYRNKRAGFSIFKVIHTLVEELKFNNFIEEFFLPHVGASFFDIVKNCFVVLKLPKQDVYHVSGDVHYLCWVLPKNKTIITVHDIMYYHYLTGIKQYIWKCLYVNSLRRARVIIYISDFAYNQVNEIISLKKVKQLIIPNAVSSDFVYQEKEFNKECPRILHIGTLDRKNLIRTIKALSGISCQLRIIGILTDEVKRELMLTKTNYSNAFDLSDKQIVKEYQDCDIVNFPSLFEGFGMPIIEGQATGRVVLTSNIEPMYSVAGKDAAVFVDPYNIDDIKCGYLKIITDDDFREMIIKNGLINVNRYKVNTISRQYQDIYNEIMDKK